MYNGLIFELLLSIGRSLLTNSTVMVVPVCHTTLINENKDDDVDS